MEPHIYIYIYIFMYQDPPVGVSIYSSLAVIRGVHSPPLEGPGMHFPGVYKNVFHAVDRIHLHQIRAESLDGTGSARREDLGVRGEHRFTTHGRPEKLMFATKKMFSGKHRSMQREAQQEHERFYRSFFRLCSF